MNSLVFRSFIRSDSALLINKQMILALGFEMAMFISDLAERDAYFSEHNKDYNGWFFSYKERRSEELGMSLKTLQRLMKSAIEGNLVKTKICEPDFQKQWISINYDAIYNIIETFAILNNKSGRYIPNRIEGVYPEQDRGYTLNGIEGVSRNVRPNNTNKNTNKKESKTSKAGDESVLNLEPKTHSTGNSTMEQILSSRPKSKA